MKQKMFCTQSDRKYSLRDARGKEEKSVEQGKKATAAKHAYIENKWQFCPVPKADI